MYRFWGVVMDIKNISIVGEEKCTGCGVCAVTCPKHAISFSDKSEGFPAPVVDTSSCVQCGICIKKCPTINPPDYSEIKKAYAAQMKDKICLLESMFIFPERWNSNSDYRHNFNPISIKGIETILFQMKY